jgi:hypothetical protein
MLMTAVIAAMSELKSDPLYTLPKVAVAEYGPGVKLYVAAWLFQFVVAFAISDTPAAVGSTEIVPQGERDD